MKNVFDKVDLIVTPTTATGPTKVLPDDFKCGRIDSAQNKADAHFTKMANFVGLPAITVPAAFDNENMPVGVHFMAKWVCKFLPRLKLRYVYVNSTSMFINILTVC